MLKNFRYRILPNKDQSNLIDRHIHACRFVYNLALETKQTVYIGSGINLTGFDLIKQLPELKKECEWLKDINAQSLQKSIINLNTAFVNFFKGHSDFPKFKKKNSKQSFNIPQDVIIKDKLIIPKFKAGINIILSRPLKGSIKSATIIKTPTNKYFVSILCETNDPVKTKLKVNNETTIGIDLGIKSFLVTSSGLEFNNPKFLKTSLSKLKYTQHKFSKNKSKKTKQKLAVLHEKIANKRKDFLHKISTDIIKNHDSIAIENLNISGMIKNHKLAQSIGDVGWGAFVEMLKYKAEWYGKNILQIGRFEPSSKMCSCCGKINKELTLKDRKWTCVCGSVLDRDINAAVNIKNFALKNHLSTERRFKNQKELPTLVGVMNSEIRKDSSRNECHH